MLRTMIGDTIRGLALGTVATAMLGAAALQGGAFDSDPIVPIAPAATIQPPAPVRVNLPFAYRGTEVPEWCYEDMPCWTGSILDDRRWTRLTSGLADALAEGEHPNLVPPTRVIARGGCFFADTTADIACMSGWMTNLREGRRF
jgi:hypothetical protein